MSNPVNTPAGEQAKAILGAILAGLTALGTALADGAVTSVEVVGISIAVLATYATVFGVRNTSAAKVERGEHGSVQLPFYGASRDRSLPGKRRIRARRQGGHVDLATVLLVGILVVLVLVVVGVV
jgi:hypothetical protein